MDEARLDKADAHERLARRFSAELARTLRALPATEDRLSVQIALCNRLRRDLRAAASPAAWAGWRPFLEFSDILSNQLTKPP